MKQNLKYRDLVMIRRVWGCVKQKKGIMNTHILKNPEKCTELLNHYIVYLKLSVTLKQYN